MSAKFMEYKGTVHKSMIKPYFQDKDVTIYLGDCRSILPELPKVDLILTDPPYENINDSNAFSREYGESDIRFLTDLPCRQFIFWSPYGNFPLDFTAVHIWDKKNGGIAQYERIYERNGKKQYRIFGYYFINSTVAANYAHDIFTGHPSQKPQKLISRLISDYSTNSDLILDPFLGSGTTCYCAKKLGRKSIGIEISEKYCQIAVRRLAQSVMDFSGVAR